METYHIDLVEQCITLTSPAKVIEELNIHPAKLCDYRKGRRPLRPDLIRQFEMFRNRAMILEKVEQVILDERVARSDQLIDALRKSSDFVKPIE